MTTAPAASQPAGDLTARLFWVLYQEFDLHTINGIYLVVPKGTPWLSGPSLGDIARQIGGHDHPGPVASPAEPGRNAATTPSAECLPHRRAGSQPPCLG